MIYCYETKTGKVVERVFALGKAPKSVKVDGKVAKRSFTAEHASVPATAGWPMECYASGVHADQAGDLRKEFNRVGVKCEVSSEGNPIYTSAKHRKQCLKSRGFIDKAAYS